MADIELIREVVNQHSKTLKEITKAIKQIKDTLQNIKYCIESMGLRQNKLDVEDIFGDIFKKGVK